MEYAIGVGLGLVVCVFGTLSGFDRDRAFYATMLVVVATYYILFAAMGGSGSALATESAVAVVFSGLAVAGFKKNLWLLAAGLAGHGVFDLFHRFLIENQGVPKWWPGFCMSYDVLAGVFFAMLLMKRSGKN